MDTIIRSLFIICSLALWSGCNDDSPDMLMPDDQTPDTTGTATPGIPERTLNYLALGDSYTIGTGVPEDDRFPVQLQNRLSEAGYDMLPPVIIATNGWTTGNLLSSTNNFTPDSAFSLVSLLIGVNNQFQGRPIEEYADHFDQLLRRAIAYAGNDTDQVFVVSIPDYGVTPFGQSMNPEEIAAEIDAFNVINSDISETYNVSYFNITGISREAADNPALIAPDNLHPSGLQYGMWIDLFEDQIKIKLNE
jgi:lysophospholipase L1-like esterase